MMTHARRVADEASHAERAGDVVVFCGRSRVSIVLLLLDVADVADAGVVVEDGELLKSMTEVRC
jgi:hypothetical protein